MTARCLLITTTSSSKSGHGRSDARTGSLQGRYAADKRAAALMSLIQSAKLNGHDPYAYLKDVLMRLPTQRASEIAELLPHNWLPLRNL